MEVLTNLSLFMMLVMPFVLGQTEPPRQAPQCRCPIKHPQERICRADIVIQARAMEVKSPGNGLPETGSLLEYSVKVTKIYKDLEDVLSRGKRIKMITANSPGKCGVTDIQNGELYLLTGLVIGDEIFFSQCEWVQMYNDLTPDQKGGLQSAYVTGCDSCLIDQQGSSFPGIHDITASSNICYHDPLGSEQLLMEDCETEFSICEPVNENQCAWMLSQRYQKCVDKRLKKFNAAKQSARLQKSGGQA